MFGIMRPCRHRLSAGLLVDWTAHLCGLCLTLRDEHGHAARLATNYDGLVVSVLLDAQAPARGPRRTAGPCPLRGMRRAEVVDSRGHGARLAAAVSLVLAAAKARDHVADGDGAFARRPVAALGRRLAGRWAAQGATTATGVGFDPAVLARAVDRQSAVEAETTTRTPILTVTEPTEAATAAAFAHTAVLAGRPHNAAGLTEAGRLFGRVAYLLDAVEDLAADRAAGAWNLLLATGTDLTEARRLCDDAVLGLRLAVNDLDLDRAGGSGRLVHALLAHEVRHAVDRAFGTGRRPGHHPGHAAPPGDPDHPGQHEGPWSPGRPGDPRRARRRNALAGCAMWALMCGTCQVCCRDPYPDPCTGEPRQGWCARCDCDCNPCDCCDCDPGRGGCGGCDCCDCCDCGCDCGC